MFEGHLIKLTKNSLSLFRFSGFAGNLKRNSKNKSLNNFVRILSFSLILSISFYSIANAGVCFLPAMKGNDCVDDDNRLACPQNKKTSCNSNQKATNPEKLSDGSVCYSCVAKTCAESNPTVLGSSKIVTNTSACNSDTQYPHRINDDGNGSACYECRTKESCPELYPNLSCAEKYESVGTITINDGADTCYKCRELTCNELYGSKSGETNLTYFSETECKNGQFKAVDGKTTATGTQCGTCIDKVTCADKYNDNNYMTEAECDDKGTSYTWTLGNKDEYENNPSACGECKISPKPETCASVNSNNNNYMTQAECNAKGDLYSWKQSGNNLANGTQCGTCIDKVTCADKYNDNNYMTEAECDDKGTSYTWTLGNKNEDENNPSACGECKIAPEPETCASVNSNNNNYMTQAECNAKGDLYSWKQSGNNLANGTQCGKCEKVEQGEPVVTCEELGKSKGLTYCPYNYDLQEGTPEYEQANAKFDKCFYSFEDKLSTGYADIIEKVDHASDGDCDQIIQKCEGYIYNTENFNECCYAIEETCPDNEDYKKMIEGNFCSGYDIYDGVCRKATCKDMGYSETACGDDYLDIETVMDNKICHQCIAKSGGYNPYCFITDSEQAQHPKYKTIVVGSLTNEYYEKVYKNNPQKIKEDFTDKGARLEALHSMYYPLCILLDYNIENLCQQCAPVYVGGLSLSLGVCVAGTGDQASTADRMNSEHQKDDGSNIGNGAIGAMTGAFLLGAETKIQNPVERYLELPGTFDCSMNCSVVKTGNTPALGTSTGMQTLYGCEPNGNYSDYTY